MYNSITLIGNLGADPDIKQTSKGGNYALLSIATHKKIKGHCGVCKAGCFGQRVIDRQTHVHLSQH